MNSNTKTILAVLVIVIVALLGYGFLTMPDNRSGTQKVGDAIHDLGQGPDKAARQLENRTPGQKVGDAIKDTGDSMKNATNSSQ
jgi:hypothetical protein